MRGRSPPDSVCNVVDQHVQFISVQVVTKLFTRLCINYTIVQSRGVRFVPLCGAGVSRSVFNLLGLLLIVDGALSRLDRDRRAKVIISSRQDTVVYKLARSG